MLEMLMQWYRRRFSDPEAIALLVILVAGFGILFFFSGLLAPLLVAIVLAYLLEWPTVRLEAIGCSRRWATSLVLIVFVGILLLMAFVVMPVAWQQGILLIRDMPGMLNKLSDFAATLPRRYPALMDAGIIDAMAENMRTRMLTMGDSVVKYSLASLVGLLTLAVYLVLVPLSNHPHKLPHSPPNSLPASSSCVTKPRSFSFCCRSSKTCLSFRV